jgi:diaminopimelate decarboxylase/aspartate kinase
LASTVDGRTALLGRGGSDTSAALLAGRLAASELEIWTDVPGLFSTDPRLEPQARLLAELAYDEALEMAASGAKVVHPRCIRAAAATRTPVLIRDTGRPGLAGTRITHPAKEADRAETRGVKAITCQKDMVVLLLQNIDTRREVGFLARVFDIFRRHGVSIDLVATSETTTTVALNGPANHLDEPALARLVDELRTQCTVKLYTHCVCVNLVGTAVRTALADLQSTMRFFDDHPLLMLSQSANDLCLSLLLNARDHELLLRRAHAVLIPSSTGPGAHQGVFGPSWQEIQA